jgi:hypothetical protein
MSVLVGSAADIAGLSVSGEQYAAYVAKVRALSPIAYWILGEHEGTIAYCQIAPTQNGTYTGVTLGNAGIGDGQVCPSYDGANSYTRIYSAALAAAFNGAAGTAMVWARVTNVGVWTDGSERRTMTIRVNNSNRIIIGKSNANNVLRWAYQAGGTLELVDVAGHSETDWFNMTLTWDVAAGVNGEVKAFFNGAQTGATQTALGVWAGPLDVSTTVVGAATTTPTGVWDGWLSHCALWDSALTPAQVASLASV